MPFPFYKQLNQMDCGPTCLRMIAKYYGKNYNADTLRNWSGFNQSGVSLLGLSETAEKMGFLTKGAQIDYDKLRLAPLPAILHWNQNHFVILISISETKVKIADPSTGIISYKKIEFEKFWISNVNDIGDRVGNVLMLEPTPSFYQMAGDPKRTANWGIFVKHLNGNRKQLAKILLTTVIISLLQLALPFLTQSMVDSGVDAKNLQYITIVLIAQLTLTLSSTLISFIRSRLQLRVSNSLNLSILSDFWAKLGRLPLGYYGTHQAGDTLQRINDNKQIQDFLTSQTLSSLFATFNFLFYSLILIFYNIRLFFIFLIGSIIYVSWIRLFTKIRRNINYETFYLATKENNATLQFIQGMHEIRINNAEDNKRWEWENIQAKLYKLNFTNLNYSQLQVTGALFINQGKDILISFFVARLVVQGQLTFGTMLAVQYIIGQLNGPLSQFIGLFQGFQDAKISVERLNEIHRLNDEEPPGQIFKTELPQLKDIKFKNFSFAYPGLANEDVLKNINLTVTQGKVTAIVGASGSGKTTFLKILLKYFQNYSGDIEVGNSNFNTLSPSVWRRNCGAVLQDGYIFNDTIARNIAVGYTNIDIDRLNKSCEIANIMSFIEAAPNGFNTVLGTEGNGISQGQKQRILIARAVYKDPLYLFFDEATNSLDANNEKVIVENLNKFYSGRTVIIVAHRLSTVRKADKIIVLDKGKIMEEGNHSELIAKKGEYYQLIKNQLELDN
jgi:ATP-binding cassette subfamily B protein